jgi:hypothetical protein
MNESIQFLESLAALTGGCSPRERFIFCGFPGDPNTTRTNAWRPRAWAPGDPLPIAPRNCNGYVAVSTFRRAPDGSWRRRGDLFASGRALMVDDVGTKVPRSTVARVPPTVRIETSFGNEQWWYFLGEPAHDADQFGGIIRSFIDQQLLTPDPGMNGVNRVGRVPGYINGKVGARTHDGKAWRVSVAEFSPERLFSCRDLVRAFALRPRVAKRVVVPAADRGARVETFINIFALLREWGMIRREQGNLAQWHEIDCPWREQHTARANTGAALREPAPENEWVGAFQCHHGHCIDRTWRDLEDWVVAEINQALESATLEASNGNRNAGQALSGVVAVHGGAHSKRD